jgi:hypothetical protein
MRRRRDFLPTLLLSILAVVTDIPASAVADDVPLSAVRERALKPKDTFRECGACPEMVVMPADSFTMGASAKELEEPQLKRRKEAGLSDGLLHARLEPPTWRALAALVSLAHGSTVGDV